MNKMLNYVGGLSLGLLLAWPAVAASVVDLAGREVSIPDRVERIILGEGRLLPALAVLEGEALTERLVGMPQDYQLVDPQGYRQFVEALPGLAEVPVIGQGSADTFSLEQVLTLRPDLAIFSVAGHGPDSSRSGLVEQLQRAGVTVLFVDFRQQPLLNTPRSIELLGRALGREQRAEAFTRRYQAELAKVSERLPTTQPRPSVFIHSRAGRADGCCESMVNGMLADLLEAAGGDNVANGLLPGDSGMLNLELLLSQPPQHYIASAIGAAGLRDADAGYVVLGPGVNPGQARASLQGVTGRYGLPALAPVREGRVHAIWHSFYNSPFNVVAVQVFARWLYPEQFADLDPGQTLAEFYAEFQPQVLDGTYWIDL